VQKVIYTVIVDKDHLKCLDTSNGSIMGSTNFIGTVLSGPIVTEDRCTVVFDSYMGRKGKIFKLPSFSTVSSFDA
jgi:hypothetical protein